jgi:hypothetical protein
MPNIGRILSCYKEDDKGVEMKKSITCKDKGAVFVSWCTPCENPHVWPASDGIQKREGCVIFDRPENPWKPPSFHRQTVKNRYGDVPKREEAWLVKPDPKDPDNFWLWERVDTQLKLLT